MPGEGNDLGKAKIWLRVQHVGAPKLRRNVVRLELHSHVLANRPVAPDGVQLRRVGIGRLVHGDLAAQVVRVAAVLLVHPHSSRPEGVLLVRGTVLHLHVPDRRVRRHADGQIYGRQVERVHVTRSPRACRDGERARVIVAEVREGIARAVPQKV